MLGGNVRACVWEVPIVFVNVVSARAWGSRSWECSTGIPACVMRYEVLLNVRESNVAQTLVCVAWVVVNGRECCATSKG